MKHLRLTIWGIALFTLCAIPDYKAQTTPQTPGQPDANQPPSLPSPTVAAQQQSPSPAPPPQKGPSDLIKLAGNVQPAVVLITVFDPSGKLLRTGTGFFVSDTGRIVTTLHTMEGAVNAVAKTADDGLYNITGVRASSTKLDLAVLDAEVKKVPFLILNKSVKLGPAMPVAIIGSSLAGKDGAPLEGTISANEIDENTNRLDVTAAVPDISFGAPVVDLNGEVIGVVTARNEGGQTNTVRPTSVLESALEDAQSNSTARWPGARPSATPRARIVYAPPPVYPTEGRIRERGVRSGRYRLNFDATGMVKSIQVLQSTGSDLLDRAAVNGLQQWKSEPGRESYVIVPLTFQSR